MSASIHCRSCQPRPSCTACTRMHSSEGHQSAVRIERLVNSRHQHTVHEPMPQQRSAGKNPIPQPDPDPAPGFAAPVLTFSVILCLILLGVHFLAR